MATDTGWRTFRATGGRWGYETGTYGYVGTNVRSGHGPRHANVPTSVSEGASLPSVASMSGLTSSAHGLTRMAGAAKAGYQKGQRLGPKIASSLNRYGVTTPPGPMEGLPPPLAPPTKPAEYGSSVAGTPFWKAGAGSTIPGTPTLSRSAHFAYPGSQPVAGVPTTNPKPGIRGWAERFAARPNVRIARAVGSALLED